jgi:phosphatidylinositol glycan class Q protein
MQDNKYLATVIYPNSLENLTENSYLIGWNVEQFHCLIACAVSSKLVSSDTKLKDILEQVYMDPSYIASRSRLFAGVSVSPPPIVLGYIVVKGDDIGGAKGMQQQNSIWVTLNVDHDSILDNEVVLTGSHKGRPKLKLVSIFSVGFQYHSSSYLISYDPQDTDAFECLKNTSADNFPDEIVVVSRRNRSNSAAVEMKLITNNINASHDLNKFVSSYIEIEMCGRGEWQRTRLMKAEEWLLSWMSHIGWWFYYIGQQVNFRISSFIPVISKVYQHFRWANIVAVNAKTRTVFVSNRPDTEEDLERLTVNELSFFLYGISYRCNQFSKMIRYSACLSLSWNISVRSRQYLWLTLLDCVVEMVFDILLGLLFGYTLYRYSSVVVQQSEHYASLFAEKALLENVHWFNNSPGGVKLNPMITKKMGVLVQFFIKVATKYYLAAKFLVLPACWLIACLGTTGLSLQICVIIDLLRIVTWPVNLSHMIFSAVFGFMTRLLYSLWLLFNGQKKNILRRRVDTYEYDPSALLFGVMLFSIMLFAIPNFAAYHYLFVSLRLGIVLVMFLLWQVFMLIKDFPFVRIVCKFFFPAILLEESFLEMILVREDSAPSQDTDVSKFSNVNLDSLLHDFSPRLSSASAKRSVSSRKTLHASIFQQSFHTQAVSGRFDNESGHEVQDGDSDNDSTSDLHGFLRPNDDSPRVFTFDQHHHALASGDRVSFTSPPHGSLRKRGDYVHHSAPVSAISIASTAAEDSTFEAAFQKDAIAGDAATFEASFKEDEIEIDGMGSFGPSRFDNQANLFTTPTTTTTTTTTTRPKVLSLRKIGMCNICLNQESSCV